MGAFTQMGKPTPYAVPFDISVYMPESLPVVSILAFKEALYQKAGCLIPDSAQNQIGCIVAASFTQCFVVFHRRIEILPDMHDLVSRCRNEVHLGHIRQDVDIDFNGGMPCVRSGFATPAPRGLHDATHNALIVGESGFLQTAPRLTGDPRKPVTVNEKKTATRKINDDAQAAESSGRPLQELFGPCPVSHSGFQA
jgi:hypothetical protein